MKQPIKKKISTHASKRLVNLFEQKKNFPEFHKHEIRYLPEEKYFKNNEKF